MEIKTDIVRLKEKEIMETGLNKEQLESVSEFIYQRRKIQAIKLYREYTGLGLKESKQLIDALSSELYQENPDKFTEVQPSGCGTAVLFFAVLVTVTYHFIF